MARFTAPSSGELRLRHDYLQSIIEANLSARELRLLFAVLDETVGWNRRTVVKPLGYWSLRTGIGQDHVSKVIKRLADLGWISWRRGNKATKDSRGSAGEIVLLRQQKTELRNVEGTAVGGGSVPPWAAVGGTAVGGGTSQAVIISSNTNRERGANAPKVNFNENNNGKPTSPAFEIWAEEWSRSCGGITKHPSDVPPAHVDKLDAAYQEHGAVILRQACRSFFRSDRVRFHNLKVFVRPAMFSYFLRTAAKDHAADIEYQKRWRESQEQEQKARLAKENRQQVVGGTIATDAASMGSILNAILPNVPGGPA